VQRDSDEKKGGKGGKKEGKAGEAKWTTMGSAAAKPKHPELLI